MAKSRGLRSPPRVLARSGSRPIALWRALLQVYPVPRRGTGQAGAPVSPLSFGRNESRPLRSNALPSKAPLRRHLLISSSPHLGTSGAPLGGGLAVAPEDAQPLEELGLAPEGRRVRGRNPAACLRPLRVNEGLRRVAIGRSLLRQRGVWRSLR